MAHRRYRRNARRKSSGGGGLGGMMPLLLIGGGVLLLLTMTKKKTTTAVTQAQVAAVPVDVKTAAIQQGVSIATDLIKQAAAGAPGADWASTLQTSV